MVLLSVDVGYFQAGWQIKMMRALKKIHNVAQHFQGS